MNEKDFINRNAIKNRFEHIKIYAFSCQNINKIRRKQNIEKYLQMNDWRFSIFIYRKHSYKSVRKNRLPQ